jgi:4-hydroxybenzoate polyprenyltransferase
MHGNRARTDLGTPPAGIVGSRLSRPRAYLLLSRLSNLPTVWSNVLAGWIAAGGGIVGNAAGLTAVAAAVSLIYVGGMFLNDAFDADFDRAHRPDRPIASGSVGLGETFAIGFLLLAMGVGWLARAGLPPFFWSMGLAAAIVLYDYRHKGFSLGPVVMGVCRGLVYCVAGSAAAALSAAVYAPAMLVAAYTASLTIVARQAGPRAPVVVPVMIAGLSLIDGVVIAWSGGGLVALAGPVCFVLTLTLQRVVPGT